MSGALVSHVQDFELICTDGTRAPADASDRCHWGEIAANVIMTSLTRDEELRDQYKTLLMMLSSDFGEFGSATDIFRIFESVPYGQQNLLFSDETVMFKDITTVAGGTRDTYYTWAGMKRSSHNQHWLIITKYQSIGSVTVNMYSTSSAKHLMHSMC